MVYFKWKKIIKNANYLLNFLNLYKNLKFKYLIMFLERLNKGII